MLELVALVVLVLAIMTVVGIVGSIAALVCWLVVLPFKLLGLVFKGIALVLALPFILIAGLIGMLIFGTGVIFALLPALPIVLFVLAVVWLVRRAHGTGVRAA